MTLTDWLVDHTIVRGVASACAVVSCVMTARLVRAHLEYYRRPQRQRYIIRIVLMVPIYAVDSLLSLFFPDHALLFSVPRDAYEAYVIHNFVSLCVDFMGGEDEASAFFAAQPPLRHMFPFGCCGQVDMRLFMSTCKLCTLQYSLLRPVLAVVTLALYSAGEYREGDFSYDSAYLWATLLNNCSVTLALYYLVYFYRASHRSARLRLANPFGKFLAVKLIVFFSFWQTIAIALLGALGLLTTDLAADRDDVEVRLGDFLLCVEMALASLAHAAVFPAHEHSNGFYRLNDPDDASKGAALVEMDARDAARNMFALNDIMRDFRGAAETLPVLGSHLAHGANRWLHNAHGDDSSDEGSAAGGDGREPRERPRAPSLEPGPAWMSSASPPRAAPAPARAPRKPRADAGGWEGGHVSDWEAGQSDEWWD